MTKSTDANEAPAYKVGKVIERHSLRGMGDELEARWLGDGTEAQSLRELADYFNQTVLRSTLNESGHQRLSGEAENTYQLLTGDDVSKGNRMQVRRALEREGVDVDRLKSEFVTHQAIHTYLTKQRNATKETSSADQLGTGQETIDRLKSRLEAVTETTLSRLRDAGSINLGSFNVFVEVAVYCTDCGSHIVVSELFADGGCDCE